MGKYVNFLLKLFLWLFIALKNAKGLMTPLTKVIMIICHNLCIHYFIWPISPFVLGISPTNFPFADFPTHNHYYYQGCFNLSHYIAIIYSNLSNKSMEAFTWYTHKRLILYILTLVIPFFILRSYLKCGCRIHVIWHSASKKSCSNEGP